MLEDPEQENPEEEIWGYTIDRPISDEAWEEFEKMHISRANNPHFRKDMEDFVRKHNWTLIEDPELLKDDSHELRERFRRWAKYAARDKNHDWTPPADEEEVFEEPDDEETSTSHVHMVDADWNPKKDLEQSEATRADHDCTSHGWAKLTDVYADLREFRFSFTTTKKVAKQDKDSLSKYFEREQCDLAPEKRQTSTSRPKKCGDTVECWLSAEDLHQLIEHAHQIFSTPKEEGESVHMEAFIGLVEDIIDRAHLSLKQPEREGLFLVGWEKLRKDLARKGKAKSKAVAKKTSKL
ncbi:hypothetical protein CGLO_02003 [Colletotrichum gloeosporioides Cg-14]|uniref:Uncharacterized protein n=1 Tax=Colletotrichum gloeosporioides (strain Cg-14) TaxID=1237896 RepID=T0M9Y9_COLGC|nr:hypothetical protein CGLO_02003 [Colletotrichum gloeosporioides Cg-14]